MSQMYSDTALHFGAAGDDTTPKPVLPQEGKFYSKAPPRFMCVKNFGADNDDMGAASSLSAPELGDSTLQLLTALTRDPQALYGLAWQGGTDSPD